MGTQSEIGGGTGPVIKGWGGTVPRPERGDHPAWKPIYADERDFGF